MGAMHTQPEPAAQIFSERPGQPLLVMIAADPAFAAELSKALSCQDYGVCLIENSSIFGALDEATRLRVASIFVEFSGDMDWYSACLQTLNSFADTQDMPVIVRVADTESGSDGILSSWRSVRLVPDTMTVPSLRYCVSDAIAEFERVRFLKRELATRTSAIGNICSGIFRVKDRRQASNLATMLSLTVDQPAPVAVGITELLLNAIEHGSLGFGSQEKERLIEEGVFHDEVQRRLELPENADKEVELEFLREGKKRIFRIKDPGNGFDYQPFAEREAELSFTKSGRGIIMARQCFQVLEYQGCGNEVLAVYVQETDN